MRSRTSNLKPPTRTIYTPLRQPDWDEATGQITAGKFRAWLAVGYGWQDESGSITPDIHSRPTNHEETATSFFVSVPVDAPPPAPLTITRDEYIEQQFTPATTDEFRRRR
jgi:hypothetical protein